MATPAQSNSKKPGIAVLGASGGVGRPLVRRALARGYPLVCQSRDANKLAEFADRVQVHAFDPRDSAKLSNFVTGAHTVVFALGVDTTGPTTFFSDVTNALTCAMSTEHVKRIIAITGVGAGETRGHGGFLYDKIIYPLFTRNRYLDKNRQEALIADSSLDWIIVRPAPFSNRHRSGKLEVHADIAPETVLRHITRDEVAAFVVDQLESDRYLHQRVFIGHP